MMGERGDRALVTVTTHDLGPRDWFAILTISCEARTPLGTFVFCPHAGANPKSPALGLAPPTDQRSSET
jgi:hypothetical protein